MAAIERYNLWKLAVSMGTTPDRLAQCDASDVTEWMAFAAAESMARGGR